MNICSPECKAAVIARMLPPHNLSVNRLPDRKVYLPTRFMPGVLRRAFQFREMILVLSLRNSGLRTRALPFSLKRHHFLPMLLLNTVAVKASVLNNFSSGRTT